MRHTVAVPAAPDALAPLQRRTVRTLAASQTLGAIGQLAGVAVATLLAEELSGSEEYAGLGGTFQTLGSALAAVLLARIASRRGRRAALVTGYALGVIGAVGTVAAAVTGSFTLLLAAALLFGGYRALEGDITIGVLTAFLLYLRMFFEPMQEISQFYNTFQSATSALEKLSGVLEEKPKVEEPAQPTPLPMP